MEAVLGGRGSSSSDSDSVPVDSPVIYKFNNFDSTAIATRTALPVGEAAISKSERSKLSGKNARTYGMVWPVS